jgi:hypothetical protein
MPYLLPETLRNDGSCWSNLSIVGTNPVSLRAQQAQCPHLVCS